MELSDSIFKEKVNVDEASNFWTWFVKNVDTFKHLGKMPQEEAHQLLDIIIEELKKYDLWLKAVCGQYDENTTELIITADGDIALFTKVQELIDKAPVVNGWRFTAHKPPVGLTNMAIRMYDKDFNEDTLHFYPIVEEKYPDEVSLVLTHKDYNEEEEEDFQTAMSIYVQNGLGEINAATQIDDLTFGAEPVDKSELIPITKLNDYLTWREKEFVEKCHSSEIELPDQVLFAIEGEDFEDNIMVALVNLNYEHWPYKPMFGWLLSVTIDYEATENGLPIKSMVKVLHDEEAKIIELLNNQSDTLFIATKTYRGSRIMYFYTKNYEQPCTLLHALQDSGEMGSNTSFFVEKDKYWRCLEEFWGVTESDEEDEEEDEGEDEEEQDGEEQEDD
jgi:hypothetical protein